ncbi:SET and MYND domain-containing protein 4 [Bicyclus anynana]|uniref:Protein-lysine N-methyltransferase SMYD4 n=1 Tax=Bicyclus anynana TaxID=110368 RepID=A0A6J1MNX1_BICAN|nr:SET and MYND domain-containing protein 4 [Bicyclus anynana]
MIIDQLYQGMIAKLTAQGKIIEISNHLWSLDTNDKRVLFVYKIFEDYNAFPKVEEAKKNDNLSILYRNLGNISFQERKHHKAWQYYNLALSNATLCSENYCLALSNRSAAFYEMKKYNECIKDIESVLLLEYPKKILGKLMKRRELCNEALAIVIPNDEYLLDDILEMKCTKDSRYVAAGNKLEVVYSAEMGRHVIAKEDIKVGEVLAVEDPYFRLLLKSQLLCWCSYCLSRQMNLLPCDSCSLALYCSTECKDNAWKEYHSVECPLMVTLLDMDFTKLELLALRTVIKARQDHNSWDDLFKTINAADENFNSEFRGHVKINGQWVYDSKYYASIHTLATNLEKRSVSDIFQKAVTSAIFLRFLEMNTTFLNSDSDKEKEKIRNTVAGLLLLHSMTSPTNMHGTSTNANDENGDFVDDVNIASAAYAFFSLLNHSCAPNVVRCNKLGSARMTMFALRPIKKGMQIYDNYGSHHALEERLSRRATLNYQYKFTCMCEACVNDWPTYFQFMTDYKVIPPKLFNAKMKILDPDTLDNLKKGCIQAAIETYKRLCIMIEMLEPHAPCMELCDCQESMKQCIIIFEGVSETGCTQLIQWRDMLPTNFSGTGNSSVMEAFKALNLNF